MAKLRRSSLFNSNSGHSRGRSHFQRKSGLPCHTFLEYVDFILAVGTAPEARIRAEVQSAFLNPIFANPQLNAVARANWTAVVSLACDDFCRSKLNESLYAVPSRWTLTTVAEPDTNPALTSVPYYSLMGDIRDNRETSRLAISRSQYLQRQRLWLPMLQSLPRIIKSDPLIFLGTTSNQRTVNPYVVSQVRECRSNH